MTRGNGATGYYLRDKGMPQDNMSNTVRIFLGTRLECAQCHNHPFDKWTQLDYFRMVAFTGGISYNDETYRDSKRGQELLALEKQLKADGKKEMAKSISKVTEDLRYGISGNGTGVVRLPHDYQYEDAKPDQVVVAKTMFGLDAKMAEPQFKEDSKTKTNKKGKSKSPSLKSEDIDSRSAYAQWMTAPENPRFTTVIANRMWHRVMGVGLIEPLDNYTDQTEASHPQLMTYLEKVMVDLKYDLKQFQRVLLSTRTFGRDTSTAEAIAGEKFHYQGPVLRRLSAEQIWDSMLTLITEDPDATITPAGEGSVEKYYDEYEKLMNTPVKDILADAEEYALRYTMTKQERAEYLAKKRAEEKAAYAAIATKAGPTLDALKKAAKDDDAKAVKTAVKQLQAMGVPENLYERYTRVRNKDKKNDAPSLARGLARASELESPARPGHFLRDFGQSDRDTIEAAHTEPAVPQVLSLLNGYVEKYVITNSKSAVFAGIESRNTPDTKIREAFIRVLSREPSSEERSIWRGQIDRFGTDAYKDLVWTLTNTHEFLFLR